MSAPHSDATAEMPARQAENKATAGKRTARWFPSVSRQSIRRNNRQRRRSRCQRKASKLSRQFPPPPKSVRHTAHARTHRDRTRLLRGAGIFLDSAPQINGGWLRKDQKSYSRLPGRTPELDTHGCDLPDT